MMPYDLIREEVIACLGYSFRLSHSPDSFRRKVIRLQVPHPTHKTASIPDQFGDI